MPGAGEEAGARAEALKLATGLIKSLRHLGAVNGLDDHRFASDRYLHGYVEASLAAIYPPLGSLDLPAGERDEIADRAWQANGFEGRPASASDHPDFSRGMDEAAKVAMLRADELPVSLYDRDVRAAFEEAVEIQSECGQALNLYDAAALALQTVYLWRHLEPGEGAAFRGPS